MTDDIAALQEQIAQLRQDSAYFDLVSIMGQQQQQLSGANASWSTGGAFIEELYRFNPFAGKIIDLLPDAMTQKWVLYKAELPPEITAAIQRTLDKAAQAYNEALKEARKHGGSVILLGADDGVTDYSKPLNEYSLRAIRWLNVLSKEEVAPSQWNENPLTENYGKPEIYTISNTPIHYTRLLRFDGTKLGNRETKGNGGWGDSALARPYKALMDFTKSHAGVFASLKDFNLRKYKCKDFAQLKAKPGGREQVRQRMTDIALALNSFGIMQLDADNEDYEIVARVYTGVLDILKQAAQIFAGSCDIPPSKLLALFNSAGLASEDTTQERAWASFVNQRQNSDILDQLEYHVRLIHLSKESPTKGSLPKGVELTFPSLFQLTESEQQDLKNKESERVERYLKWQVVTPDEVAEALAQGVPIESVIDIEARKRERAGISRYPEGIALAGANNGGI